MVNPNEDTEFNDALRAHGILPPKPPSRSPSPDLPHLSKSDITQTIAATATTAQLGELLDNEQLDSDDEAMFQEYRAKRIAQMRKEEKRGRFGSLMPLGREDFVKEVTEGSKERLPGDEDEEELADEDEDMGGIAGVDKGKGKLKGTGVVVFLYKDSYVHGEAAADAEYPSPNIFDPSSRALRNSIPRRNFWQLGQTSVSQIIQIRTSPHS